jgi:hypothetical protein
VSTAPVAAPGDALETELAVAADFLAEHGFGEAADAVRVLYPRLPRSVMAMRRVFAALAPPDAGLSGWELEASFQGVPPVRVPVTEVRRSVVEDRGDHRTLGLSLRADPLTAPPGGGDVLTGVGVAFAGKVLVSRGLAGGPAPVTPGDTISMNYDVSVQDFLLPEGVVAAFVPDGVADPQGGDYE